MTAGNAGAAGGVSGSAGGELAARGATGDGASGTGGAQMSSGWNGTAGGSGGTSGADAPNGEAGGGSGPGGTSGGGGEGASWLTPPPVPPALAAPAGATVKLHAHAVGAQIYTCTASGGTSADAGVTSYAWAFKAPDAQLYDASGAQVGTHGAGPHWTWSDGSVANGTKVAELNSPLSDAITWLLLRVSSTSGTGVLDDVSYVQRLNTTGGEAPPTGCDAMTVGTDTRAAYTADYYFYSGGGAATWLTAPKVPDAIALPDAVKLKIHDRGIGVQVYGCLANGGGGGSDAGATTYAWVFKAPDALLYDMNYVPVATLGAGPSWTSSDGSTMTARELAHADAPEADAIPWLLLKEFSQSGPGVFGDVAIVQLVNSAGGTPPTTRCDATNAGTEVRVPYAADYYFFVSSDT